MEGLKELLGLSDAKKQAINEAFGSIDKLYQSIFALQEERRNLYANQQAPDFASKQKAIDNKVYDIQDKLDQIGLDGHGITTEVSNDYGEIIIGQRIQALNDYLKPLGTNFEIMRKWLKERYNI